MQNLFSRSELFGTLNLVDRAVTKGLRRLNDAGLFSLSGKTTANGRPEKLYRFEDLPRKWQKIIEAAENAAEEKQNAESNSAAMDETQRSQQTKLSGGTMQAAGFAELPDYNRKIWLKNSSIINAFKGLRGKELDSAITKWNAEHGESLSKRTVYRILQMEREGGELSGKYGKTKGRSSVTDEWFSLFLRAYTITGTTTSIEACREVVRGYAIQKGEIDPADDFPSANAFARRLKNTPQQALNMMRQGLDFWKQHNSYSIDVDRQSLKCGEVFVADHAKFDFFVRTKNDKLVRPWISALCDYKSRLIVGYDLFLDEPNGDHIIIVLKRSFEAYGIPRTLLFDNGKDYRRKDIGGGRAAATNELVDDFSPTITNVLGIQIKYAIPYNSQSKPIERVFGIFRQYFDKFIIGYAGSDGKKRPDKTKKAELDAAKALRQGKTLEEAEIPIITEEKFFEIAPEFIKVYNRRVFRQGKAAGFSPLSMWNSEAPKLRQVRKEELAILCTSSGNPVKVHRNELRDSRSGEKYVAAWMAKHEGSDQMFWLRVDPEKPETAYCFFADVERKTGEMKLGAFVGTAERKRSIRLYDNSEENQKALAKEMELKQSIRRFARDEMKKAVGGADALSPDEYIRYMSAAVNADHKASCERNGCGEAENASAGCECRIESGAMNETQRNVIWQISRFTGIPEEIERMEHAGVLKKGGYKVVEEECEAEEPQKLVRFRKNKNRE